MSTIQIIRKDVLDHGYVEIVESWGSDERIIESARMSTQKGFQGWGGTCARCGAVQSDRCDGCDDGAAIHNEHKMIEVGKGDEKLLRFLYEHKHSTPFEFAGLTVEIQAPIFVFREWHRHRTQSYTEASARYAPLPNLNYVPTVERLLMDGGANKQAQGTGRKLSKSEADLFRAHLSVSYEAAERLYQASLPDGVPKELARLVLPVGRYSQMRASANLRNWLGFLTLRMDAAAQWEIRCYANAVGEIIAQRFPRTWELFVEGKSR